MQKIKKVLYADLDKDGNIVKEEMLSSPIPVIRNHYNSRYYPKHREINTLPSLTIPDEAMTITELINRFANGVPLALGKEPMYDGEEELTDLDRLDLSERKAFIDEKRELLEKAEKAVRDRREAAEKMRIDKIIAERVAEKLAEQKQEKGGSSEAV